LDRGRRSQRDRAGHTTFRRIPIPKMGQPVLAHSHDHWRSVVQDITTILAMMLTITYIPSSSYVPIPILLVIRTWQLIAASAAQHTVSTHITYDVNTGRIASSISLSTGTDTSNPT
jgi:anti-sigma-K factor RskA